MVAHTLIPVLGQRQVNLCAFKTSMVYIASSRTTQPLVGVDKKPFASSFSPGLSAFILHLCACNSSMSHSRGRGSSHRAMLLPSQGLSGCHGDRPKLLPSWWPALCLTLIKLCWRHLTACLEIPSETLYRRRERYREVE